jgi:hypothetical protein
MIVPNSSLAALTLAMSLASLCCCSSQPRKADPPDSGDTDSDTGTQPDWSAPGWEMTWIVQAGGGENIHDYPGDMGHGLCPTAEGGVFVTGYTYSEDALFGEGTANEISYLPPDEGLIYLARYDEHGTPAWVARASSRGIGGYSCAAIADGGAVITGNLDAAFDWYGSMVFGAGEPDEVSVETSCSRSPFLAKYTGNGTFEWVTAADRESGYGHSLSVAVSPNGDFCVAGAVLRPFTFSGGDEGITILGTEIEGNKMTENGFLARFSADGTPLWARELSGKDPSLCVSAAALADGSCAVSCSHCGLSRLQGGESPDAVFPLEEGFEENGIPPECGALTARYTAGGDLMWATDLGARGVGISTGAGRMAAAPDCSIAVGGAFQGTMEAEGGVLQAEGVDLFLARLSDKGEILWTALAQGPGDSKVHAENIYGVSISPDGDIAVAGAFSGTKTFGKGEPNETTLISGAGENWFNGFTAMYSPEGRLRWAIPVAVGPAADDITCPYNYRVQQAGAVVFSGPDVLYITGTFLKDAAFGTSPEFMVTLQPYGCADMFLMKLERIEAPR